MFETLMARGAVLAERQRRLRKAAVAADLREGVPTGVRVEEVDAGVMLSGRGLIRRSIAEPAVRWIAARLS